MPEPDRSRALRQRRPPRSILPDPRQPPRWLWEEERTLEGTVAPALTVFLIGAECPFTCVFCDLWRSTLPHATPPGALPAQLAAALQQATDRLPPSRWSGARLKLYNASNFFEARAVPPQDDAALARLAAPFDRTVVECHPRLVPAQESRCRAFAERLEGRLEVALGLETAHPEALARLNKGSTLEDFQRAAAALRRWGLTVRAFVLLGAPYQPPGENVLWAVRSARRALEAGAEQVALIPLRGEEGGFPSPTLEELEAALDQCLDLDPYLESGRGVVTADLWDLERLAHCPTCFDARRQRLARINLRGVTEPPVECPCAAKS